MVKTVFKAVKSAHLKDIFSRLLFLFFLLVGFIFIRLFVDEEYPKEIIAPTILTIDSLSEKEGIFFKEITLLMHSYSVSLFGINPESEKDLKRFQRFLEFYIKSQNKEDPILMLVDSTIFQKNYFLSSDFLVGEKNKILSIQSIDFLNLDDDELKDLTLQIKQTLHRQEGANNEELRRNKEAAGSSSGLQESSGRSPPSSVFLKTFLILPHIHAIQFLNNNFAQKFKKMWNPDHFFSMSWFYWPPSRALESKVELSCDVPHKDQRGVGALGCYIFQKARSYPSDLYMSLDEMGPQDFLWLSSDNN